MALVEIKPDQRLKGEIIDFSMIECGSCGIPFFVPTQWKNKRVQSLGEYHCPNGCTRVYCGKTDAQKLQEKLDEERVQNKNAVEVLQNRWLDEMNAKKKVEKKLKRLHNGVCPCCNRSFENLQRHIKTQHPELLPEQKKLPKVITKKQTT